MIHYLVTAQHPYTMAQYLGGLGLHLAEHVEVVPYPAMARHRYLPGGTYVFSDLERLNSIQTRLLAVLWDQLARAGDAVRLVNHPARSLRRAGLIRAMHEQGINRFRAFAVDEPGRPWRYPVFVRQENEHTGPLSPLLYDDEAVRGSVLEAVLAGIDPRHLLVVEFCDTADAEGIYRKYSAFRVADHILPRHVLFSRKWAVKDLDLLEPQQREEVRAYVRDNPHERELMRIFELAEIRYGRIDYALLDGVIQVWEINTNPMVTRPPEDYPESTLQFHTAFAQRFAAAFAQLEPPQGLSGKVPVTWEGW